MSELLLKHFDLLATAPDGVVRLRELILTLAVQGKLVPQDANDEPASVLLQRIRAEKDRLIAEGKIKRDKPLPQITDEEKPFELPVSWRWVRFGELLDFQGGGQPPKSNFSDCPLPDYVRLIQIRDLGDKPQPVYIPKKLASKFCTPADVMVGRYGASVGKVFWGKDGAYNVALVKMVDDYKAFDRHFLYLLLMSPLGQSLFSGISRSAQDGFNKNDIEAKLIPSPPFAEQARIVARVEELMRLCDALEAKGQLDAAQHVQMQHTLLGTLTDSTTPEELAANWQRVAAHFDLLLDRPEAVDALEQTILQLAVRGLLVPQDPSDEPASALLQRIRAEKDRLIAEGRIKRDKQLAPIADEKLPCALPNGWKWARLTELGEFMGGKTPSTQQPMFWDGAIPWITPKDMKRLRLSDSEDKVTQQAVDDGLALIPPQSVLVVVRSGILRRTVPTTVNEVATTINQDMKALVLVCPELAAYVQLIIRGFERFILLNLTKVGTTVESIQFDAFAAQPFPFPPLAEQSRIVARIEELRQLCNDLRQRLTASRTTQGHLAEALVEDLTA